ncbi:amidase domain-containing protein [Janibacter alkaliphilus]|uniref:Putative amidase domain-containing protein n=1 Tax=Janibacter alkaliphilus TaxID=1069963 RepID=A0A852XAB2_9MICO|nr:amidase domain-containing protein [Janibacter alkaliphilus]NYG38470.1 hypothetical protein [Janibacter alkaliphilus]
MGSQTRAASSAEHTLRRRLGAEDPLSAGNETLNVGKGSVSSELISSERIASGRLKIQVREVVDYPYLDSSGESMGEAYVREVVLQPEGDGWRIESNEVPEGSWPLLEGATAFEGSLQPGSESVSPVGSEPADAGVAESAATALGSTREDAASYALRYALSYNDRYRNFGNDCTNFISQALRAGGFNNRHMLQNKTSTWSWWYDHEWIDEWSHSWSVANYHYKFHLNTKRGKVSWTSSRALVRGDLVYADWRRDGVKDHVWMVTGYTPRGDRRVSGHTADRRNVSVGWLQAKAKETYSNPSYRNVRMQWGEF